MSELKHYGVLGMKWGVRKEQETSVRKAKKRVNSDQITSETTVKRNPNGSITVSNLREISSAHFDNEAVYKKWLNNENNYYAEDKGGYAYIGGKRVDNKNTSISGIGYTLNFTSEADYNEYYKNTTSAYQKNFIHSSLEKYKADVDKINSMYKTASSEEDLKAAESLVNSLGEKIAIDNWHDQLNGYYEYQSYLINSIDSEEITDDMKKEAIKQLEDELASMGFEKDSVKKDDTVKKTEDAMKKVSDKTISEVSKEVSDGKKKTENILDKIGSAAAKTASAVGNAVRNAVDVASSFIKGLFKKK